jgi:hypothetical protein
MAVWYYTPAAARGAICHPRRNLLNSRLSKLALVISLSINVLLLFLAGGGRPVRESHADAGAGEELVPYMEILQHLSHKLGLAIQAKNEPLASFYVEEVEETIEIIRKKFPVYDDMQIASLAGAMMVPQIEPLEISLKAKNWVTTNASYTKLIDSCNSCHAATAHKFVVITAPTTNPFNQTFAPK